MSDEFLSSTNLSEEPSEIITELENGMQSFWLKVVEHLEDLTQTVFDWMGIDVSQVSVIAAAIIMSLFTIIVFLLIYCCCCRRCNR